MLRNATCFSGDNIGAAQGIEQRCLTMIDMAHDGHNRRTRLLRFGGIHIAVIHDINV